MPEFRAVVHVMLRRSILDPQGRAVEGTLHRLGHVGLGDVRVGKRIELTLTGERDAVLAELKQVAERVLSNPVMEDVELELHEIQEA
jgi:phosphoribosylformylglycinamidine synthase